MAPLSFANSGARFGLPDRTHLWRHRLSGSATPEIQDQFSPISQCKIDMADMRPFA